MVEIIGPLRENHHAEVVALVNGPDGLGLSPSFSWPPEALEPELKYARGWGLWHDEELKAFVLWREIAVDAEITCLATHPKCQGKGHMKNLLGQLFNALRYNIWLLEVHEDNQRARQLYEKLGFYESGRRLRYYRDGAAAVLYQRPGKEDNPLP